MRGGITNLFGLNKFALPEWEVDVSLLLETITSNLRYNPENIKTLEHYVDLQSREKGFSSLE